MTTRIIVAATTAVFALLASCAQPQAADRVAAASGQPVIAITVDDIPEHSGLPPGVTRAEVARDLVVALKEAGVPAFGFINGGVVKDEDGASALEIWAADFPVGNHGWSHLNLNEVSIDTYQKEIAANEPLLARLSPNADWKWYRYPFLAEGDDPAKRLAIRRYLGERGYRIAAVTIDFWDWAFNDPYARCVAKGDSSAIAALEDEWLAEARHHANASREMSQALYGRDIPYVLLTHVGGLDARMFPRMIRLYRDMGFRFVTLEEAQQDPAYAQDNDPHAPAGGWTLERKMIERGLPLPAPRESGIDLATLCS